MKYLYFAYGANTNIVSMQHRCPTAIDLGLATLPGYAFRFALHADILPSEETDAVEGVLWEIDEECLKSLDRFEGYPNYYERCFVDITHHGETKEALVYYMVGGQPDDLPFHSYFTAVAQGYEEHGISIKQLTDAIESVHSTV